MRRRLLILAIFGIWIYTGFSQIDRTRTWVFGQSVGIKFPKTGTMDTISSIYKPGYPQYEGTGVYNDSNGNLLYYVLNGQLIGNDHKSSTRLTWS